MKCGICNIRSRIKQLELTCVSDCPSSLLVELKRCALSPPPPIEGLPDAKFMKL